MAPAALILRAPAIDSIGRLLGWGSLAVGVTGLVAPAAVSTLIRVDRPTVWVLAMRDLASALLLFRSGGRYAFLTRALFDFGDGVLMIRRRPSLAALAWGTSLVALIAGVRLPR